uniref:CCHC-type domain-containing protein n=1 Tax=Panagrolaimus davidi TaxID=227884 RepID=A0A914QDR6_9BILA
MKLRGIDTTSADAQVEDRPMKVKQNAVMEPGFNTEGWNRGTQIRVVKEKRCKIDRSAKFKKPRMVNKESCEVKDDQKLNFEAPKTAVVCVLELFSDHMRLKPYDGNPEVNFDSWIRRLTDDLEAHVPTMNDAQKLARLKSCLIGKARDDYDAQKFEATDTYADVVTALKKKFQTPEFRSLALARLSLMEKKLPYEDLNSYIERFERTVRQATAGQPETVVQQKLLDELILKLDPELAFHLRTADKKTYAEAVTEARKMETFLKLKNMDQVRAGIAPIQTSINFENVVIDELARQIAENLRADEEDSGANFDDERHYDANDEDQSGFEEDQLGYSDYQDEEQDYDANDEDQLGYDDEQDEEQEYCNFDSRICYYCGKQGHVVRYCLQRMEHEEEEQRQQDYYDRHQVNAVNTESTREEVLKLRLQNECLRRQNINLALFGKPC